MKMTKRIFRNHRTTIEITDRRSKSQDNWRNIITQLCTLAFTRNKWLPQLHSSIAPRSGMKQVRHCSAFCALKNISRQNKIMICIVHSIHSQPADVFIENWVDGRKVAFDVSVVSPVQEAVLQCAADVAGAAIDMRKSSKTRAHLNNCRAQGTFFQPLVVVVVAPIPTR